MSQTTQAKRDPVAEEKRSWLAKVLGFSMPWDDDIGDDAPQQQQPPPDPRAISASTRLINLHGEAVALGLDLGGQRDVLKGQIEGQILGADYDGAEVGIGTLSDALGVAKTAKTDWDNSGFTAAADKVAQLETDTDPQAGTLRGEQQRIAALATAGQFRQAADAAPGFAGAVKLRTDLYPARKDWLAGAGARAQTLVQAEEAITWGADLAVAKQRLTAVETEASDGANNYAALLIEAADLTKTIGEAHAKVKQDREDWLGKAGELSTVEQQITEMVNAKTADAATHKESLEKIKTAAGKPDFAAALEGLKTLAALVATGVVNARAKVDFEQQRKAMAQDEAAVMRIGDVPADQKLLRDAFIASRDKTGESVTKNEFAAAVTSLTKLKEDLKAALAARRLAMDTATETTVNDAKQALDADIGGGTKAWKAIGSVKWKQAVNKVLTVQLDEDFTARYDEINNTVADAIAADPLVKEGFKDWSKWTKDPQAMVDNAAKIEGVMSKILELQSKQLGLDPATPVVLEHDDDKLSCGGWSSTKAKIALNPNSNDFGDFKELLDTLTHENTHAYQEKLIKELRDGTITKGDPNYSAAMTLELNDSKGYVTPDESKKYRQNFPFENKNPYMAQACEKHAWRAGRMAGQGAFEKLKAG